MPSTHDTRTVTGTRHRAIVEFLNGAGVAFELLEHEPTMSAAAEARAMGRPQDEVAKTVVLHDGRAFVLAAIPAAYRLDLHKIRAVLGATRRLQLAAEDQIARHFPFFEVGALPPFGPIVPAAEVIDVALTRHERILCPAGDHRHSVLIAPQDVMRMTKARTADICEE
jgi:prolyl-tRNA editing enzyme YbaK/EbsC (Cys-tRNA(Pro) deacylase)